MKTNNLANLERREEIAREETNLSQVALEEPGGLYPASSFEEIRRFQSWQNLLLIPLVETVIIGITVGLTVGAYHALSLDLFTSAVTFFLCITALTITTLVLLRRYFPLRDGIYSFARNDHACGIWTLKVFLSIVNLGFIYENSIIPTPFRKPFYKLLGTRMARGVTVIAGRLLDPELVTLEEEVVLGEGTLVCPHVISRLEEDKLILARVHIGKNVIVGVHSIIMPGVSIGENSLINALSLIPMNTVIPPNESMGRNTSEEAR